MLQYELGCRIPTPALDIKLQRVGSATGLVQQISRANDELEAFRFGQRLSRSILQKSAEQRVILISDFFPALSIGEQVLPIEVVQHLARPRIAADGFRELHRYAAHEGRARQDVTGLRRLLIEDLARKIVEHRVHRLGLRDAVHGAGPRKTLQHEHQARSPAVGLIVQLTNRFFVERLLGDGDRGGLCPGEA